MSDSGLVFVIDGSEYPTPTLDTFDMSERRVMFDLSGIVEEDYSKEDDETEQEWEARCDKMDRHPGFVEALMHVAYARGNPELRRARVQEIIDKTNYREAIAKWGEAAVAGDADNPPSELTSTPDEPSVTSTASLSSSSGPGSSDASEPQVRSLERISTTGSVTQATSPVTLSAV